jgi:hypothetical protein
VSAAGSEGNEGARIKVSPPFANVSWRDFGIELTVSDDWKPHWQSKTSKVRLVPGLHVLCMGSRFIWTENREPALGTWGSTHNVNTLVTGNTNLGALRTQIYTDDTHCGRK